MKGKKLITKQKPSKADIKKNVYTTKDKDSKEIRL